LRKIFGVLLSTMLVFASVSFASAATKIPPDPYKTNVPPDPYKTNLPPDPYKSSAASGIGIASCANTVTRTINPVPAGGADVALVTACSSVTVTVSNIGPNQVMVFLVNVASGTGPDPVRSWGPANAGTSYTWFVDTGTYRVVTYNAGALAGYPTWATYRVVTH
jgi:hypothetical protein